MSIWKAAGTRADVHAGRAESHQADINQRGIAIYEIRI